MNKKNTRKGFTIVELVIVIAVIAILATVLVPTFGNVIEKANDSKLLQALKNEYTSYTIEAGSSIDTELVMKYEGNYYKFHNGAVVAANNKPSVLSETEVNELTKYWDAASDKMLHKFVDVKNNETDAATSDTNCDTCGQKDGVIEHFNHTLKDANSDEVCDICSKKH